MSMSLANIAIWSLINDSEAQDALDYHVTCDDCAILISETQYEAHDGLCEGCFDSVHFTRSECGEVYHQDDRSETYKDLCEECGCSKRTKQADELWAEIEDLAGSWSDEDSEINK